MFEENEELRNSLSELVRKLFAASPQRTRETAARLAIKEKLYLDENMEGASIFNARDEKFSEFNVLERSLDTLSDMEKHINLCDSKKRDLFLALRRNIEQVQQNVRDICEWASIDEKKTSDVSQEMADVAEMFTFRTDELPTLAYELPRLLARYNKHPEIQAFHVNLANAVDEVLSTHSKDDLDFESIELVIQHIQPQSESDRLQKKLDELEDLGLED